jgi:multimeric flavodoxin WrbA
MKTVVFHGSPRKGNTYFAIKIFMDELIKCGDVEYTEFHLLEALPKFCIGCQLCLSSSHEKCPNFQYVAPILDAIIKADALIFATPHYGACSMPGIMKTLFDHIDFLVLSVTPREEMFNKKAFILTTGAGSTAAIKSIKGFLKNCGVNRVYSLGIRLFTDKWNKMQMKKQVKTEKLLRRSANKFFKSSKGHPYLSTVFFYHMSKFILKRLYWGGKLSLRILERKRLFS